MFICRVLRNLWNVVLQTVGDRIKTVARKPSLLYLYKRLDYSMAELKAFFHAGGNGMPLADIETNFYQVRRNNNRVTQTV